MAKERYYAQPRDCIDWFREEYEFLSNFYPAKLMFDGISYDNAESAYQAQKLDNPEERRQFEHLYADEVKRIGKKLVVRPDWDEVKLGLMEQILYAKFTQNPHLAQLLVNTGESPLLYGNLRGDTYWGICLATREGENHLGRLLMELRAKYQKEGIPDGMAYHPVRCFGPIDGIAVTDEDITQLDIDCIVNAANYTLLGGGGVDGVIHREAGPELREECRALGGCNTGEAKITNGYRLKAKYIIHTVGPIYKKDDESLLVDCYWNSLDLARENSIHSIAFPSISTGKFSFPKQKATQMAVETIRKWLDENNDYGMQVILSCVDYRIYEMACEAVKA